MKKLILGSLLFIAVNHAFAATQYYSFVGVSDPSINFVLSVDFSLPGYTTDNSGNKTYITPGPYSETFYASYLDGNLPSASSNQFRFYGENGLSPEGWDGCLYALNSIGVCTSGFGGGKVQSWLSGYGLSLHVFDTMGDNSGGWYTTMVALTSITSTPPTSVPLPSALILLLSGMGILGSISRKKIAHS